jgi:hypothetical protein
VSPFTQVANTFACDCTESGITSEQCYQNSGTIAVGVTRACPFIYSEYETHYMTLTVYPESFPPSSFCQFIEIYLYPAFNYRSDGSARLGSEVFNKNPPNEYSVIFEYTIIVVGQIVTSGIQVSWDPTVILPAADDELGYQPLQLCIPLEAYIEESNYFSDYELGSLTIAEDGSASISRIFPEPISATVVDGVLCGNITKPGIYIGVKVITNADALHQSLLGQGFTGSVLYWMLLACAFFFSGLDIF